MISLAVKFRPKTFEEVSEQEVIRVILQEQVKTSTFKSAYLFCGEAGTGKTSVARIFANEINKGQGNPIEIDAASNNGVDNIREIIENAKRKSLESTYKIYILDEAHMLSTGAWNALLKLLEEPPANTVFMMCTTDPQKIPATIMSRVQRYDFSKISLHGIVKRLEYIMLEERTELFEGGDGAELGDPPDYGYQLEALEYIAKMADGGMRDAITMLDKCISLSNEITIEGVVSALGTVDYNTHFELLYHLNVGGTRQAVEVIETVYNSGKDIKQFIKQFQYFILDVCKYKLFGSFKYIRIPELAEYKLKLEDEEYEVCLDILEWVKILNAEIKWESNVKAMIESAVILFCIKET